MRTAVVIVAPMVMSVASMIAVAPVAPVSIATSMTSVAAAVTSIKALTWRPVLKLFVLLFHIGNQVLAKLLRLLDHAIIRATDSSACQSVDLGKVAWQSGRL
jgi:hypothetical protein